MRKIKLSLELEVEKIFSYAVRLEQEGRQKNTIFCFGNVVYILNADKTILLRLKSPKTFEVPIGFYANDYEGDKFEKEGDGIVFTTEGEVLERKKYCRVPTETFTDAEAIYQKFWTEDYIATMNFPKKSLELIDSNLSHIEFSSKDKKPLLIQRDICSGSVIKLRPSADKGFAFSSTGDEFKEDFGPLGMRTNDFFTLFAFDEFVKLCFLPSDKKYFIARGINYDLSTIISGCLYDEVGEIYKYTTKEEEDGWEIQEDRHNVQEVGGVAQKKASSCRKRT